LPGIFKTRERSHFGNNAHRGNLGHPAQRLQGLDHGAHLCRRLLDGYVNRLFQALDPLGLVIDFVNVIQQRGFLRRLIKVDLFLDPGHVFHRPALLHRFRRAPAVTQQELVEPMTCAELVLLGVLTRAHQIAQGFVGGIGNPHRREVAGAITARQFGGVAAIGLDSVAGLDRDQRGRDDLAGDAERCQLPVQDVACRPGLVAGFPLLHRPQLGNQFANRFQAVRDDAQRTDFSVRLGNRSRDGVRVDIQTKKSYLRHATNSFRMRLCAAGFSLCSVTRATANRWLVAPL